MDRTALPPIGSRTDDATHADAPLPEWFDAPAQAHDRLVCAGVRRTGFRQADAHVLLDRFAGAEACAFVRIEPGDRDHFDVRLPGAYSIASCAAGGWLASPRDRTAPSYWFPQPPMLRKLDADGHVLAHRRAEITGFRNGADETGITLGTLPQHCLDIVAWRLPAGDRSLAAELAEGLAIERQPWFMWSSHTSYRRAADLYLHLVFGHVYENHEVWPRFWRVGSELDACALYVTLAGLERATGKRLYAHLKRQVVLSVIDRQRADGGWAHGEWTPNMESHYRLVNAAVLMLAMYLEEDDDERVRDAARKGAAFLVGRANRIDPGVWFMHDSLEGSPEGIAQYPFPYSRSTALGKSASNMLILNTHLDTLVTLERLARSSAGQPYAAEMASARAAARTVIGLAPASWLYGPLFRILDLTLLPKQQAMRLPVHLRALKRAGWKYLAPMLHRFKALFPRLVMPNGYIDRALCQEGFSTRYQSVHVWDLVRYLQCFPDDGIRPVLERALDYTQHGAMRAHWMESPDRQDALGFWAEALYRLCLIDPDPKYRRWLAEAMLDCEAVGIGLPPSLLGANGEALPRAQQRPCPVPADARLRVANLARGDALELVVVNPCAQPLPLTWEHAPHARIRWTGHDATESHGDSPTVPAHGWLAGSAGA